MDTKFKKDLEKKLKKVETEIEKVTKERDKLNEILKEKDKEKKYIEKNIKDIDAIINNFNKLKDSFSIENLNKPKKENELNETEVETNVEDKSVNDSFYSYEMNEDSSDEY